ncbi:hypothetical protein HWV62_13625 [Athelia sp. TMB]|nr:hypothetical protein HWV62_13625 [Athelia sp. TMB]
MVDLPSPQSRISSSPFSLRYNRSDDPNHVSPCFGEGNQMAYWETHTTPLRWSLPSRAGEQYISPQDGSPCVRLAARLLSSRSSQIFDRKSDSLIPYRKRRLEELQEDASPQAFSSYASRSASKPANLAQPAGPRLKRRRVTTTKPKQQPAKVTSLASKIRAMQAELELFMHEVDPIVKKLSDTMDEVIDVIDGVSSETE